MSRTWQTSLSWPRTATHREWWIRIIPPRCRWRTRACSRKARSPDRTELHTNRSTTHPESLPTYTHWLGREKNDFVAGAIYQGRSFTLHLRVGCFPPRTPGARGVCVGEGVSRLSIPRSQGGAAFTLQPVLHRERASKNRGIARKK